MKKKNNMPVAMNKGIGWFFKMAAEVFMYFEDVIVEMIEDNRYCNEAKRKK